MYIHPLTGNTVFREFIGTVSQESSILRGSELVLTKKERRSRAALKWKTEEKTKKPLASSPHAACIRGGERSWRRNAYARASK